MFQIYKARWILPCNGKIIENGAILVENGVIFDVLENSEFGKYNLNIENTVNFSDAAITPGFVNLHTHLQLTDLKGNKNDSGFINWVIDLMKQYSALTPKEKEISLKNGIEEALLSGTTCVAQISRDENFVEIFNSSDIKTYFFLETFSNSEEMSEIEFKNIKEKLDIYNQNKSSNMYFGISPHSVYNVHESLWKKISDFASENNILVHTHLAESEAEMEWLKNGHSDIDLLHKFVGWNKIYPAYTGLDPVQYLEKLGVLEKLRENLTTAHLNQLSANSLERLLKYGTKIAHCPRSNVFLHKKTIDNAAFLNPDFLSNTGIGTDSKFSNYDLSIANEAKFIQINTKLDVLNLLNMLTINAAKILKLDEKIGSLEKQKDADFLVFKLDNNESYANIFDKSGPDNVYIRGNRIVDSRKLAK